MLGRNPQTVTLSLRNARRIRKGILDAREDLRLVWAGLPPSDRAPSRDQLVHHAWARTYIRLASQAKERPQPHSWRPDSWRSDSSPSLPDAGACADARSDAGDQFDAAERPDAGDRRDVGECTDAGGWSRAGHSSRHDGQRRDF